VIRKVHLTELPGTNAEDQSRTTAPAEIWATSELPDLAAFWPRSDRLGSAQCYAFQCADILEVWCDTIGAARNIQPQFVAVVDAIGHPLMLLPLGIQNRRGTRILTFLDGGVSDYNVPVLFSDTTDWNAQIVSAIWKALRTLLPPFDIAVLEKMADRAGDFANPLLFLGSSSQPDSGHAINLSGTWENFAAERLPYRQDSRRNRRKLSELGTLKFEVAESPAQSEAFLDAMIRQKTGRFNETGASGFNPPGKLAYYHDATHRLRNSGVIHLSALKLDDTIIATHWGFVAGMRFYYLMPSYEAGVWRSYSAGRLLAENLLEWSYEHGLKAFDFGVGDEEYKFKYCDVVIPLYRAVLPITARGWVYHGATRAEEAIRNTKLWKLLRALKLALLARRNFNQ
jgi:CelD/BcsL family acetyltransferase involved in cellulose biosynthesis